jgi:hypothetical protein
MVQAAHGARRVALQEERIESLIRAGQDSMLASAREQLRVMSQAQTIRMQLLSAAQREIIESAARTGKDLTELAAKPTPPGGAGAA